MKLHPSLSLLACSFVLVACGRPDEPPVLTQNGYYQPGGPGAPGGVVGQTQIIQGGVIGGGVIGGGAGLPNGLPNGPGGLPSNYPNGGFPPQGFPGRGGPGLPVGPGGAVPGTMGPGAGPIGPGGPRAPRGPRGQLALCREHIQKEYLVVGEACGDRESEGCLSEVRGFVKRHRTVNCTMPDVDGKRQLIVSAYGLQNFLNGNAAPTPPPAGPAPGAEAAPGPEADPELAPGPQAGRQPGPAEGEDQEGEEPVAAPSRPAPPRRR